MKTIATSQNREQGGAMIGYLALALVITAAIAAIAGYVVQNVHFTQRRQDMVNAREFAQGGAAIACQDLNKAYTNTANSGDFIINLTTGSSKYSKDNGQSTSTRSVYKRTIKNTFTNADVHVKVFMDNSATPVDGRIVATATFGNSTQTSEIYFEIRFGPAAAIISTAKGDASTVVSKGTAQGGDVVIDGAGSTGASFIDGGVIANGAINTNLCTVGSTSEGLYGTSGSIPDYTSPGSSNQLFSFSRYIAAADKMKTHYTNSSDFMSAMATGATLEGIIVVDLPKGGSLPTLSSSTLPFGINVRGTLIFNFTGAWNPLDKIVNTADVNINKANLSGLVPGDPATYTTGYPPTFTDPTKNPLNVNIKPSGYDNFMAGDDLPALMYNNAILDMHGDINICGVVYSPSFMEIENKAGDDKTQYIRGSVIGGGGIYVENSKASRTVISYDVNALDKLATSGTRGKVLMAVYQK